MSRMDYVNWQEASDDLNAVSEAEDAADRAHFEGPITNGMLMTAINQCAYGDLVAHQIIDCVMLARIINGWLTPVDRN